MNLNQISLVISTLAGKSNPDFNMPKEQFETILHISQLKHYKRRIGLPESYIPGAPDPKQRYASTQRIEDDMLPFVVNIGLPGEAQFTINTDGVATLPTDFFYPLSLIYNVIKNGKLKKRKVDLLCDEEWTESVTSEIIKQTKLYPIANLISGKIRFEPKDLQVVEFSYLKLPPRPVYAATYNTVTQVMDYDNNASTNLLWDELNQLDIIAIFLSDIGVPMQKPEVYQVAESVKNKGI